MEKSNEFLLRDLFHRLITVSPLTLFSEFLSRECLKLSDFCSMSKSKDLWKVKLYLGRNPEIFFEGEENFLYGFKIALSATVAQ